MHRPRILISASADQHTDPYERAVAAAGGDPVVRRPTDPLQAYLDTDPHAILLAGGASVAPERYGSDYEPGVVFDPEVDRDEREFALLAHERGQRLPILGICRGLQVLNVAFGGTLWQYLPDRGHHDDHAPPGDRHYLAHGVRPDGGYLGALLGTQPLSVNSIHDQAVRTLAPALRATVHTGDGVVEGVESPDGRVIAVQWHPEELVPAQERSARLFADLVQRALDAPIAHREALA